MRLRRLLAIAGVAALAAGNALAADAPLYADFQRFCVATGARPDAIKAALAAADVTPHPVQPGDDPALPSWDHKVSGYVLNISYGTSHMPRPGGREDAPQEHCMVTSDPVDTPGVTAILEWTRLQPSISHKGPITTFFFQYEDKGGARRDLLDDDAAFGRAVDDGTAWNLAVDWASGGSLVFLGHYPAARAP